MIDPKRPLELNDGTPVTLVYAHSDGDIEVRVPSTHPLGRTITGGDPGPRLFNRNGTRAPYCDGPHYTLRNAAPTIDLKAPLETVDGKPVTLVAETNDGRILVEVTYGDRGSIFGTRRAMELRFRDGRLSSQTGRTSGDDLRNKVEIADVYLNVYGNGTIGATRHTSLQNAKDRAKVGLLRVGVLQQRTRNGVIIGTAYTALVPETRTNGRIQAPAIAQPTLPIR